MNYSMDIQGAAALSICESTLICLGDLGILGAADIVGILEDAKAHMSLYPCRFPPKQIIRLSTT